jgi:hypothetical protein
MEKVDKERLLNNLNELSDEVLPFGTNMVSRGWSRMTRKMSCGDNCNYHRRW